MRTLFVTSARHSGKRKGQPGRRSSLPAVASLLLASSLLVWTGSPSIAQIYKVTDEDGVEFTDQPQTQDANRKVEEVELKDLNTAPATQIRPRSSTAQDTAPQDATVAPAVTINSPANESTIAMGPGNFSVSATAEPPLGRSERLQLLIDGQAHGEPQPAGSWFIEGALRGPHDLQVVRQTANGMALARSESVRIYVLRPSIR